MKKAVFLFTVVALFISCNKDLVEKPDNLIDKKVMADILYDMSILVALKYQGSDSLIAYGINPKTYIFKKYKIDSLQLAKSTAFYAADYREYKKMFDNLNDRLKKEKLRIDLIVMKEAKKEAKKEIELKKAKEKKVQDSIKNAKKTADLMKKNLSRKVVIVKVKK